MKHLLTFLLLSSLAVLLVCCSDNGVSTNNNNTAVDPTILQTDSSGNILGGDTTDWCMNGFCNNFKPCYPNPVNNKFTIPFNIRISNDTLSLFTLEGTDTLFLFKNQTFTGGYYTRTFYADSLNIHKKVKRIYLKGKKGCFASPLNCKDYGDIQFN